MRCTNKALQNGIIPSVPMPILSTIQKTTMRCISFGRQKKLLKKASAKRMWPPFGQKPESSSPATPTPTFVFVAIQYIFREEETMSVLDETEEIVKHIFDVLPGKSWQEYKKNFREDENDDNE